MPGKNVCNEKALPVGMGYCTTIICHTPSECDVIYECSLIRHARLTANAHKNEHVCGLWMIGFLFLPAVETGTLIPEARATVEAISKKT